ncbi:MAG: DUF167 domain-containing protein [Ktedonobacteraceae bacterium]|nr:DUF167 domain-containing protein [Ktedonobacteraceae bacterium]MBO0793408.1 DUF167 domain-containing protein [Ktedonobacteraceae bacterium]
MRLDVRVQPRSSKNSLEWGDSGLKARVTAPPVDSAANEALIAQLAAALGIPKRAITIVRGASSRQKVVEIEGMTLERVQQKIR